MFTAHGPVDAQGDIAGDGIVEQTRLTLQNLARAVSAAAAGDEPALAAIRSEVSDLMAAFPAPGLPLA